VRRAMEQLKEIGYLDYSEVQKGRSVYFQVHNRYPKLRAPKTEQLEVPKATTKTKEPLDPQLQEKIELLDKLGISLQDLEKIFKSQ
jgi:hypothetical protein